MYKQLTHLEAEQIIASQKDLIIADVRNVESYQEEHINNAMHFSMLKLQEFCELSNKNRPILVYCYLGVSSQSVAKYLIDQGFSEVYSLVGGFEKWKAHHPTSNTKK